MRTFAPGLTGLAQQHRLLPRSLALSERRTSTSSCSRMASRIMFPSLLNRKSMGILMSSVSFPSPAIWNRGAVSLLLPSLSSAQRTNTAVRASVSADTLLPLLLFLLTVRSLCSRKIYIIFRSTNFMI